MPPYETSDQKLCDYLTQNKAISNFPVRMKSSLFMYNPPSTSHSSSSSSQHFSSSQGEDFTDARKHSHDHGRKISSHGPGNQWIEPPPQQIKCVLIGDGAVGKTSLVVSYTTNGYPQEYVPTAFDNYSVLVRVDDQPISLQLCDTAGQDEFDSLRPLCYPNTDIFLLCFSVVSPSSFANLRDHWVSEVRRHSPGAPCLLVGTQCDLRSDIGVLMNLSKYGEEPVNEREAHDLAKAISAVAYIECSALTQLRLKDVFDTAILAALNPTSSYLDLLSPDSPASARNSKILLEEYKGRKSFRRLKERLWQASVGRASGTACHPQVCPSPKPPARKHILPKLSTESAPKSPLPTRPPRSYPQQQLNAPPDYHDKSHRSKTNNSNNMNYNTKFSNNYNSNNFGSNNDYNDDIMGNNDSLLYNKNNNNNLNNNNYYNINNSNNNASKPGMHSNARVLTSSMTPPLPPKSPQIHPTRSEQSGLTDHWLGVACANQQPINPSYHHHGLESPRLQKKSTNGGIKQRWKKLFSSNIKSTKLPPTSTYG